MFEFLDRRLRKSSYRTDQPTLRRRGNDLEADLDHYADGPFPGTAVKAMWRFAGNQKLREIEVRRVVEQ